MEIPSYNLTCLDSIALKNFIISLKYLGRNICILIKEWD